MESEGQIIEVECGDKDYYTNDGDFAGKYYMYVPENVNADTPIHIYIPGSGGSENDTVPITEYVSSNGSNSIVIMPQWNAVNDGPNNYAVASLKISDEVIAKYGLTGNNVTVSGFSNGAKPALLTAYDSYAGDYKSKISAVVTIDQNVRLNAEEYKVLAENDVMIYAITKKDDNSIYKEQLNSFVNMGGQVVLMKSIGGHVEKNKNAFKNGIIDYLNGTGELSGLEGYTFEMYDTEKKDWYTLTYDELKEKINTGVIDPAKLLEAVSYTPIKFNIDDYDKVQSNDEDLQTYIDVIRNNLKIEASLHSYNSTTMVPSQETDALQKFFEGTQSLFGVIESDTTYLLKVGLALKEMDANLAANGATIEEASELEAGQTKAGDTLHGDEKVLFFASRIIETAALGALTGTAACPGPGTAIGAVAGAIAGLIGSLIDYNKPAATTTDATSDDKN